MRARRKEGIGGDKGNKEKQEKFKRSKEIGKRMKHARGEGGGEEERRTKKKAEEEVT